MNTKESLAIQEPLVQTSWEDRHGAGCWTCPSSRKTLCVCLAVDHGSRADKAAEREKKEVRRGREAWGEEGRICGSLCPSTHSPGALLALDRVWVRLFGSKELSWCCKPKPHKKNRKELREEESSLFLQKTQEEIIVSKSCSIFFRNIWALLTSKHPGVQNRWLTKPFFSVISLWKLPYLSFKFMWKLQKENKTSRKSVYWKSYSLEEYSPREMDV